MVWTGKEDEEGKAGANCEHANRAAQRAKRRVRPSGELAPVGNRKAAERHEGGHCSPCEKLKRQSKLRERAQSEQDAHVRRRSALTDDDLVEEQEHCRQQWNKD